jgi:hypothetical protein
LLSHTIFSGTYEDSLILFYSTSLITNASFIKGLFFFLGLAALELTFLLDNASLISSKFYWDSEDVSNIEFFKRCLLSLRDPGDVFL